MTVVPTKQLSVTTVQAADSAQAYIASIEVADHLVILSSGSGQARIQITTDGKTLRQRSVPKSRGLRGAKLLGDELWLTGEYGLLAVSSDLAATWTRLATPTRECLWDIARDAKGGYWIGGSGGVILRGSAARRFALYKHTLKPRSDRADPRVEIVPAGVVFPLFNACWDGKKLAKVKGLTGELSALATGPTGTIVMVGDKGIAFRSTDGGTSFKKVELGAKVDFNDIAVIAGGFVAAGAKGTLRRSEDDGVTWKPLASQTRSDLWAIGSWGDGGFAGGEGGLVLKIAAPSDTYWRGAVDRFAPAPIVTASFDLVPAAAPADRDRRYAELAAEAATLAAGAKLAAPRMPVDPRDAAVLDAIDDVEGYRIFGDHLQGQGDVRGEYVALAIAQPKEAKAYAKRHAAALLPDELRAPSIELTERWGFVERARLFTPEVWDDEDGTEARVPERLGTLLGHPAARFLKSLTFGILTGVDNDYSSIVKALQKAPIPSLRELFIGDFESEETETSWSAIGDASKLWPALPNLEVLKLHSGSMKLGRLVLPKLRSLEIFTGGLTKDNLRSVEKSTLPALERLTLYFGQERYGCDIARKDLAPLLHSDRFPRLRHLGLVNTGFADELVGHLHRVPLVAQVESLALGLGTLSDAGARTLATYARGFAHLRELDLGRSYLTPAGIKILKKALPGVKLDTSRQRYREGDEYRERYTAIGE